ncbi:40S ribosomal S10-like protein, putative [Medicago truncatula]|uniref:40S ribosomal S10-like protein, putative n=1 Tax=Medicago truncatula TaxID=3880 RepID=A0A072U5W0_MEDTR|nr:40S ribosomal S10-like protein, putative [Medicago truncatula]
MDNLFNAQVRFNSGNRHLFKVWIDVTLKDLKDQLSTKDSTPNLEDTRWVEDLQYARLDNLQTEKIMLTDNNYHSPRIEMKAMLLRSTEDILKSLILPQDYV